MLSNLCQSVSVSPLHTAPHWANPYYFSDKITNGHWPSSPMGTGQINNGQGSVMGSDQDQHAPETMSHCVGLDHNFHCCCVHSLWWLITHEFSTYRHVHLVYASYLALNDKNKTTRRLMCVSNEVRILINEGFGCILNITLVMIVDVQRRDIYILWYSCCRLRRLLLCSQSSRLRKRMWRWAQRYLNRMQCPSVL